MAFIKPFKALRPSEQMVSKVNSPPYDIISRVEANKIIATNPYSFLKVVKPEATIAEDKELSNLQLAEIATKNLQEFINEKVLVSEKEDCFYLYQQSSEKYNRIGLVACLSVDDYLKGTIKKHENVNIKTYQGRAAHIKATMAHTGCIMITYKNSYLIDELIDNIINTILPVYNFESDDGIKNVCWKISGKRDISSLIDAFQQVDSLYIADGHHRAAAAVEVAQLLKSEKKKDEGNLDEQKHEYMYFPAVLIPNNQMDILAYHRVINISSGFDQNNFLKKLKEIFQVEEMIPNRPFLPVEKHEFGMNLSGQWYRLMYQNDNENRDNMDIINQLDVSILQNKVLNPLIGIENPQKDDRIEFIGGEKALPEIDNRIRLDSVIAFTLFPTSVNEVIEVSDLGQVMPPKSTWFEPKLRSGIFVHLLK